MAFETNVVKAFWSIDINTLNENEYEIGNISESFAFVRKNIFSQKSHLTFILLLPNEITSSKKGKCINVWEFSKSEFNESSKDPFKSHQIEVSLQLAIIQIEIDVLQNFNRLTYWLNT